MNQDQACTILWALGDPPAYEDRRAAVKIVMDLLTEERATVEPPVVNQAMVDAMRTARHPGFEVQDPGTFPPGRDPAEEAARLRKVAEDQEAKLAGWSRLWGRLEELTGQRGADDVINRVAFLAEGKKQIDVTGAGVLLNERDELLAAARTLVSSHDIQAEDDVVQKLADVVAKIDNAREDT